MQVVKQKQSKDSAVLDNYLYRQPEPNLSIKIEPVEQKTKHTFVCACQMCRQYDGKKVIQMLHHKTAVLNKKIKQKLQHSKVPSQYFLQILKKLVLPPHKIVKRGVDISIPQICFFKDGESRGMFMNRQLDDFSIKKIGKNNVNPGLIQRVFNERRRDYREELKKKLGMGRKPLTSQNKPQMQKNTSKAESTSPQQQLQQKDLVIIKYTDGLQSMIPQTQFIMLTLRRKQDPIWKSIQIIRNNISVTDEINSMFFVKYQKENIKFTNLLQRARTLARIYAGNIIAGEGKYISDEDQNQFAGRLLQRDRKAFAEYVVYRMVAFVEYFHDEEIIKLSCKILINEINKPFLIDVTCYKKHSLGRFVWTNDTYKKKLDQQQQKLFIDKAINVTEQLQQKSKLISELMEHKYNEMKNKYGITMEDSDNEEEQKNNMFWKKIHPEFQGLELSDVLINDKQLTVAGFKKKYLGYKEEKKPIVKEFATHMIKVLHKTTPKLKVAHFHQVPFTPSHSGYFSSRRPNTCSLTKRSSFSAITTPTKNKTNDQTESAESPRKSTSKQAMRTSRTPTSSTYRNSRKSGCHLHVAPGEFSITKDFLNFHKGQKIKEKM